MADLEEGSPFSWIHVIVLASCLAAVILLMCAFYYCMRREVKRVQADVRSIKDLLPPTPLPVSPVPLAPPPAPLPLQRSNSPHRSDTVESPSFRVPPAPSGEIEVVLVRTLKVRIVGASGVTKRPAFCTCQIRGKPQSRFATRVASTARNPTWEHEADFDEFVDGDSITFSLWFQDGSNREELVAEACLSSARLVQQAVFEGELPLSQARAAKGAGHPSVPWTCACSYENEGAAMLCYACDAVRPPGAAASAMSLWVRVAQAPWAHGAVPLFSARWSAVDMSARSDAIGEFALRSDWDGDIGFRFRPKTDLVVTALGRRVHAGMLQEVAAVTLWSADARAEVAAVSVGPGAELEKGYAFGPLKRPVLLQAHKEYRISQKCSRGMADLWFDGRVEAEQVRRWSASLHIDFLGSVCQEGHAYPDTADPESQHRRAGMLNLKLLGPDPVAAAEDFRKSNLQLAAVPPGAEAGELAEDERDDLLQIRLVCMSPAPQATEC